MIFRKNTQNTLQYLTCDFATKYINASTFLKHLCNIGKLGGKYKIAATPRKHCNIHAKRNKGLRAYYFACVDEQLNRRKKCELASRYEYDMQDRRGS